MPPRHAVDEAATAKAGASFSAVTELDRSPPPPPSSSFCVNGRGRPTRRSLLRSSYTNDSCLANRPTPTELPSRGRPSVRPISPFFALPRFQLRPSLFRPQGRPSCPPFICAWRRRRRGEKMSPSPRCVGIFFRPGNAFMTWRLRAGWPTQTKRTEGRPFMRV